MFQAATVCALDKKKRKNNVTDLRESVGGLMRESSRQEEEQKNERRGSNSLWRWYTRAGTCICGHPSGTLRSPTLYGIQVNTRTPEISAGGSPGRSSQAGPPRWGENVLTQTELCGVSALPKRLGHRRNFPAYFLESSTQMVAYGRKRRSHQLCQIVETLTSCHVYQTRLLSSLLT